jgi:hypothetical protein
LKIIDAAAQCQNYNSAPKTSYGFLLIRIRLYETGLNVPIKMHTGETYTPHCGVSEVIDRPIQLNKSAISKWTPAIIC